MRALLVIAALLALGTPAQAGGLDWNLNLNLGSRHGHPGYGRPYHGPRRHFGPPVTARPGPVYGGGYVYGGQVVVPERPITCKHVRDARTGQILWTEWCR